MQELFDTIDALMPFTAPLVAIDGPCGGGKSTLAKRLLQRYPGAQVFHMDDFFLQPDAKTPERLAQLGGNVDHERFLSEVLQPLAQGLEFIYHAYSCRDNSLLPRRAGQAPLYIIEGSYSLHPALRDCYDIKVFLDIDDQEQAERILKREGSRAERFFKEWIPMENHYFDACKVRECSDFLLSKNE